MDVIDIDQLPKDTQSIIVADLHLHARPAWHEAHCWDFIAELLCLSNAGLGKFDLILLGDAIETRDKVDARVINMVLELVLNWDGSVYWLAGQHDSYLPGRLTFEALRDSICIIDRQPMPHRLDGVHFVPYARDLNVYKEQLAIVRDLNPEVLLTHMPLKEVLESYGAQDPYAIELDDFKGFKQVISGDIHNAVECGNVAYVGAPKQTNWKDYGVTPYIGVLTKDLKFTRVELQGVPEHIKFVTESVIRLYLKSPFPALIKVEGLEDRELKKELLACPLVLDLVWEPPAITERLDQVKALVDFDPTVAMKDYQVTVEHDLDEEELLEVGLEVYNDSLPS